MYFSDNLIRDSRGHFSGVPYLVRIMILKTSPGLTITVDDDGLWRIERKSMMSTNAVEFRLDGEEFIEKMSSGVETREQIQQMNTYVLDVQGRDSWSS